MSAPSLDAVLEEHWRRRREPAVARLGAGRPGPAGPHRQLRRELFQQLLAQSDAWAPGSMEPVSVRDRAHGVLSAAFEDAPLTPGERQQFEDELVDEATGYGVLAPLFAEAAVSDILVNGPNAVFVDRFGRLERTTVTFDDDEHLRHFIVRLVASLDRRIDQAAPYVDVRLRDGSRLHAVLPPLVSSPVLCIRRARAVPFTMEHLVEAGTLTPDMPALLADAVLGARNIIISGGVGTGKTTLLSVLAGLIPPETRIVTVEETAELRLPHPHVVALEARLPNTEGQGEVPLRTLVRNALRMRADRLIVGEVRGGEVFDMLQAMNTGHAGSLTTVHANSAADALRRLSSLVLLGGLNIPADAARELVVMTVQVIVQLERAADGRRRVVAIEEVNPDNGTLVPVAGTARRSPPQ